MFFEYIYIYEQYNPKTARRNTPKLKHSIPIKKNETPIETELTTLVLYGETPPIHIPYFPKDSTIEAINDFLTKREDMVNLIMINLKLARTHCHN